MSNGFIPLHFLKGNYTIKLATLVFKPQQQGLKHLKTNFSLFNTAESEVKEVIVSG
jgi:hypothetical protein